MPPPLPVESDAESATEEIAAEEIPSMNSEPTKAVEEPPDTKMKEDKVEEEEDEEDGEEYVVEAIKDHRSDFKDNQMRYWVKWNGYSKVSDRTWETEENLEGAREILEEYWRSLPDGKPVPGAPKSTKKRNRQSTGSKQQDSTKRAKTSKAGRKSNGALEQDASPTPAIGYTDAGDDDWKPPAANAGAWDPLVQSVDTVIRENNDGDLYAYLIWNNKNEDGRFYRSKAKLPVVYRACPQRMLHFYEKHLVFSSPSNEVTGDVE